MDDAEICLVLQFLGFVEFGVRPLLLQDLLHEALVRGFGEPALLVQESEDSWRTRLETHNTDYNQSLHHQQKIRPQGGQLMTILVKKQKQFGPINNHF